MLMFRRFLLALAASLALAGCAIQPSLQLAPPIVFVHGNGDTAANWLTTVWRFESQGWPPERLHAIDLPYPLARDDDSKEQPGRSSTTEHMAFLKSEVERVLKRTQASQVVLIGNSRGGNAIRNYIQNGGGEKTVSHAILGGTPNHGVWAVKGFREANEFSGTGPFLTGLNRPKNAAGDEVSAPVKWLTIRSENNDKFAQPDGLWIGARGTATNVSFAGPELKGALNLVIPRIDHRETSFSPAAFDASYRFITGRSPEATRIKPQGKIQLDGKVSGLGLQSTTPQSGNFVNNLALPGAQFSVYAVDPQSGLRLGTALHSKTIGVDGRWGPFSARGDVHYEFVISAPGYATTHIYRSPFARSSDIVNLRVERLADADRDGAAVVSLVRPRGYFDPQRDQIRFDGQSPPPGIPPNSSGSGGAGAASSKIKYVVLPERAIIAEFNGERVVGRAWKSADGHLSILELHQ